MLDRAFDRLERLSLETIFFPRGWNARSGLKFFFLSFCLSCSNEKKNGYLALCAESWSFFLLRSAGKKKFEKKIWGTRRTEVQRVGKRVEAFFFFSGDFFPTRRLWKLARARNEPESCKRSAGNKKIWRRVSGAFDENCALSVEQCGLWLDDDEYLWVYDFHCSERDRAIFIARARVTRGPGAPPSSARRKPPEKRSPLFADRPGSRTTARARPSSASR